MIKLKTPLALPFGSATHLNEWFDKHHDKEKELWIRIFKKSSERISVTWKDCVICAIAWGWIDSQRQKLDEESYAQRFTPRRKNSVWSQKNREYAEALIANGSMKDFGLFHVNAAKSNGSWDNAYAGSARMQMQQDFLDELSRHPETRKKFALLNRTKRYSIYRQIQTSRTAVTRKNIILRAIKNIEEDQI